MSRRTLIILLGLALMVSLFFYDRSERTDSILSAEVIAIEDRDTEAGPDSWHVTARTSAGDITLEPLEKRPDLSIGQTTCVTAIARAGQPIEYRWEPSASC